MTMQDGKLNLAHRVTSHELAARRAVQAACIGFFVDMFDVYLPIAVLAPALIHFIPAGLSGTTQACRLPPAGCAPCGPRLVAC